MQLLEIAPTADKMLESHHRGWGLDVWGRCTEPQVRRVDIVNNSPIVRGKRKSKKNYKSNH